MYLRRADAISLLRQIVSEKVITLSWVSLAQVGSDRYELHLKSEDVDLASFKRIIEKYDLRLKEDDRLWVIYREDNPEILTV